MSERMFRLPRLQLDNLRGDLYGGLTAAVVALPLAMAFGVASGAGPVAGLYGAVIVGFLAALFGGTPSQVSGPTGPMTVVMAGLFVRYTAYDPAAGVALAFTVVMMGGIFQILFGIFRLGRYISLVPYPVISGFMSGIGAIIVLIQVGPLLGHPAPKGPLDAVATFPELISHVNPGALALGAMTLAIVYLLPARINRILPAPLLALLAGTAALLAFFPEGAVTTLGDIPTGFPSTVIPTVKLKLLPGMVKSALMLAVLGSLDSLLTSLVADSVTRQRHDSDRELIGQGIGNTVAGFFGGLPGAGATMRTVVNVRAGGRTPLSGVLHALALLACITGLGSFARHIPHVVLAGILIKVGTDIIDWKFLKRIRRAPLTSVALMFTVLFTTVFVDLITSVAIGMVAASLLLVHRMAQLQLSSIRAITDPEDESPLCEEAMTILKAAEGRILAYHLSGPLSFGAAKDMARRLSVIDGYTVLVLDLSDVPLIDFTTAMSLEEMIMGARESGRHVLLSGIQPPVRRKLEEMKVLSCIEEGNDFPSRLHAFQYAARLLGLGGGGKTA